ncbi:MAG: LamG-like jellyroll fold domain-containing protein, partial [Cyclobacteriaceae bacterium]
TGSGTVSTPIVADTWYHVAFNISGSNTEVFVNGVSVGFTGFGMSSITGEPLLIGSPGSTNPTEFFSGEIDEVRVWNYERTAQEISDNVYSTLIGNESGLIANYRFDETTGTNLPDLAGNNDGTLTNMAGTEWVASAALQTTNAPTNLIAYRASETEIALEWTDNTEGETSYIVERSSVDDFSADVQLVTNLPVNSNSHVLTEDPLRRYYRVSAENSNIPSSAASSIEFATTEAFPGYAMSFDGTTGYVEVDYSSELNQSQFTVEAWVKVTGGQGNWRSVVASRGVFLGYVIQANNLNEWEFLVGSGTTWVALAGPTLALDTWTHVAMTVSGGNITGYVDGVSVGSAAVSYALNPSNPLRIGAGATEGAANFFLPGEIDEVKIWNSVKTDFSDRFESLLGDEPNLVAYYPLDENTTDWLVFDRSVNTNDGTPVGSPTYVQSLAPIGANQNPFITTWITDDGQITIPTTGSGYNYSVTWTNLTTPSAGDGSISGQNGNYTITGLTNGDTYQVEISGDFPRIFFNYSGDFLKIRSIEQWGNISWSSMEHAFAGCNNLIYNATDAPDLSNVTSLFSMFNGSPMLNGDFSNWNVSNVQVFQDMFFNADSFNGDITTWNTSSATNMAGMFAFADNFNQDIGNWDVSNVTWMSQMFDGAISFNQNLGTWDISSIGSFDNILSNSGLSVSNYDATISGWAALATVPSNLTLGATGMAYCASETDRQFLIDNKSWTISGDVKECSDFYYPFTATTENLLSSANDGTVNGNGVFTEDRFGYINRAFRFTATSDNISGSDIGFPTGTASRSVAGWMRKGAVGTFGHLLKYGDDLSTDGSFALGFQNDRLHFSSAGTSLQGTSVITDGFWHFVAVTYDGTNVVLYVDGVQENTIAASLNTASTGVYIMGEGVEEEIDNLRIYNSALTSTEVNSIYAEDLVSGSLRCSNSIIIPAGNSFDFSTASLSATTSLGDLYVSGDNTLILSDLGGQLGVQNLGDLGLVELINVDVPTTGYQASAAVTVGNTYVVQTVEEGHYVVFTVSDNTGGQLDIQYLYTRANTLALENGNSYDFVNLQLGNYTGGSFYYLSEGGSKFWGNNGQLGLVDLGDLGDVPLNTVTIPSTGYNQFGVDAIPCHTYVTPAQAGETGHIVFRVHDIEESGRIIIDHFYTESEVLEADYLALLAFYDATSGDTWTNNSNWKAGPVYTWYGVSVIGGRVTQLSLANNNLQGSLPTEIGNLTELQTLNLEGNQLTAVPASFTNLGNALISGSLASNQITTIPDLSAVTWPSLTSFSFAENNLSFSQIGGSSGVTGFAFDPQYLTNTIPTIETNEGESITIDFAYAGTGDQFQWSKNGAILAGETNSTLVIPGVTVADAGSYELEVQSTTITGIRQLSESVALQLLTCPSYVSELPTDIIWQGTTQFGSFGNIGSNDLIILDSIGQNLYELSDYTAKFYEAFGGVSVPMTLTDNCGVLTGEPIGQAGFGEDAIVSITYDSGIPQMNIEWFNASNNFSEETVLIPSTTPVPAVDENDSSALVAIYNATGGSSWTNSGGWLKRPVVTWHGVTVVNGRVTELDLSNNNLQGTFPPEIGNLTLLTDLRLGDNQLTGTLPIQIGNLTQLNDIYLQFNQLSGDIPVELGSLTSLNNLNLAGNQFSGTIPTELGSLSQLIYLDLSSSPLTGTIPSSFANLDALQFLYITSSGLSGDLPTVLGEMNALEVLLLNDNQFSGSIPLELANATNLTNISIPSNLLTGNIPSELGSLTNLLHLDLQNNQLTGTVPAEFNNFLNLNYFNLSNNNLSGVLPNLTNLVQLTELRLENNLFTGTIPDFMGTSTNLFNLELAGNSFTGAVPVNFNQLTSLDRLNIRENELEDLPDLSNLVQLTFFDISFNKFGSADINPNLGVITNNEGQRGPTLESDSSALVSIYNALDGTNWSASRSSNWLTDTLVVAWQGVEVLDGRVISLDISNFNASGALPSAIGDLDSLKSLTVTNNNITSIPTEIGSLTKLATLQFANNALTTLPSGILNLNEPIELNVSGNRLDFEVLSPYVAINSIVYSPQKALTTDTTIIFNGVSEVTLSIPRVAGTGNVIEWYQDDVLFEAATDTFLTTTNAGIYRAEITNPSVPELTLATGYFNVRTVGSNQSFTTIDPALTIGSLRDNDDTTFDGFIMSYNIGDVNADGVEDFAILLQNKLLVFFGGNIKQTPDLTLNAEVDFFFSEMRSADFNGDGLSDIILGKYNEADKFVDVFFGSQTMDLVADFTITPSDLPTTNSNFTVNVLGDVNDDGYDDFLVIVAGTQQVYIYFGAQTLQSTPSITISNFGTTFNGLTLGTAFNFGFRTRALGDVNGDGIDDFGIADIGRQVYKSDQSSFTRGLVYVYFGGTTPSFSAPDLVLTLPEEDLTPDNVYLGINLAAGDINGDGFNDVLAIPFNFRDPTSSILEGSEGIFIWYGGLSMDAVVDKALKIPAIPFGSSSGLQFINRFLGELIVIPDIDEDGDDELLISSLPGTTKDAMFVVNDGDIVELDIPSIVLKSPNNSALGVSNNSIYTQRQSAVGDFNGDGGIDVLLPQLTSEDGSQPIYLFTVGYPIPLAPTNLIAYASSETDITFEWTDNSNNETAFLLESADDYTFTTSVTIVDAAITADATTITKTVGADIGKFYRLTAINGYEDASSVSPVEFATTEAFPGYALDFDGTSNYINAPESIGALPTLTISAWVYPRDFGVSNTWVYWRGNTSVDQTGGEIYITPAGIVAYGESDVTYQSVSSTNAIPLNQWTHVALVKTGGSAQMYINGVTDGSAGTIDGTPPNGEISLGARIRLSGNDGFFDGLIDEVRVWNTVKSDFSDRYTTLNGNEANLVAYYPLDENIGLTTVDRSTNTNDGTITGATFTPSNFIQAPTIYNATDIGESGFTINYNAPSGAEDIFVDVSIDPEFGSFVAQDVSVGTLGQTFVTTDLSPATTYYFRAKTIYTSGTAESKYAVSEPFMRTPGNALDFDGVNDYVDIGSPYFASSAYTKEAWIQANSTVGARNILSNTGGINDVFWILDGVLSAGHGGGFNDVTATFPSDGSWNHVAVTYDAGSILTLYLNGVVVDQNTSVSNSSSGGAMTIGSNSNINSFFDGRIDEVRVWSINLGSNQIQQNMFKELVGNDAALEAYYRFDEGIPSGTNTGLNTLLDYAGTNDGTLNNFGLAGTSTSNWVESGAQLPTLYNATTVSTSGFTANWKAIPFADQIMIEWSDDNFATGALDSEVLTAGDATGASYSVARTLTTGTVYQYRIRVVKSGKTSNYSKVNSFMVAPGNALNFANAGYGTTPYDSRFDITNQFTFDFWFKANDGGVQDDYIINKGNRFGILWGYLNGNIEFFGTFSGTDPRSVSAIPITDLNWHHIAYTYDGSVFKGYKDGVEVVNETITFSINHAGNMSALALGSAGGNTAVLNAQLDEFRIYNRGLDEAELLETFSAELVGDEPSLILYYRMDEVNGAAVLPDHSSHGSNSTLTNLNSNFVASGAFADVIAPTVTNVTASPSSGILGIGQTLTITLTAEETGLVTTSASVNGIDVSGTFIDNTDNTYSLSYTVSSEDFDASAGAIPLSITLEDAALNSTTVFAFTDGNSLGIDANAPTITAVTATPSTGILGIGETFTITLNAEETGLLTTSASVNGIDVSGTFVDNTDNTYSLSYTVSSEDFDASAGAIPLSITLEDAALNSTTVFAFTDGNSLGI